MPIARDVSVVGMPVAMGFLSILAVFGAIIRGGYRTGGRLKNVCVDARQARRCVRGTRSVRVFILQRTLPY